MTYFSADSASIETKGRDVELMSRKTGEHFRVNNSILNADVNQNRASFHSAPKSGPQNVNLTKFSTESSAASNHDLQPCRRN